MNSFQKNKLNFFNTIWKKVFFVWLVLSFLILLLAPIFSGKPETTPFIALSVFISAVLAFIVGNFKSHFSEKIRKINLGTGWKFFIIGGLFAFLLESEFWLVRTIFNVAITAHQNYFINLGLTMPWYLGMTFLFYKVQKKYKYSLYSILILGGIYSFFIEGVVKTLLGGVPLPFFILFALIFPINVLSYSCVVFCPSVLLREELLAKTKKEIGKRKYFYAMLPLLGILALVPIVIIFGIVRNFVRG